MASIHFIERVNNLHRTAPDSPVWESGYWVVSEETAARLVGGDLYLHTAQDEPSHFGGRITGYRVQEGGSPGKDQRLVFQFEASLAHKGVRTPRSGWGMEKKIVW